MSPSAASFAACLAFWVVLSGHFTASTWTGMNLARVTTDALPPAERARLVAAGRLSPASLVPAFSPPADYPRAYFEDLPPTRVRALYWERKTTGAANFNHAAFPRISDDLLRDALWVLRHRPGVYFSSVGEGWEIYFRSPSDLRFLGIGNIAALRPATDAFDVAFLGRWPWPWRAASGEAGATRRYWGLLLGLPVVLGYGLATAAGRGAAGRALDRSQRLVVAFLCFNVVYVAFVGNLLEVGENNRFRFETDPFSVCLLGVLVDRVLVDRWRRR